MNTPVRSPSAVQSASVSTVVSGSVADSPSGSSAAAAAASLAAVPGSLPAVASNLPLESATSVEEEAIRAFLPLFRARARGRVLTADNIALRALLLGKSLTAAFTPITNPTKLANGQTARQCIVRVLEGLSGGPSYALPYELEEAHREVLTAVAKARAHQALVDRSYVR